MMLWLYAGLSGIPSKLESIKGYNGFLTVDRFKKTVQEIGISIIGQTDEICPADKKIYALRDITGTIESNPLICGSILSKKIAEGIDYLVMDIKVGNGAFMKDKKEAIILGDYLKNVAEKFDIKMKYSITDMNQPLGNQAGLICEVIESIETLKGNGPNDLLKVVSHLANECLTLAGIDNGMQKIEKVINNGKAYEIFEKMIIAHGGDISSIKLNPSITKIIKAKKEGYLNFKNTKGLGMSIIELGGGRKKIDDIVDSNAGFRLIKKHGSYVNKDDEIAEIFCSDNNKIEKGILTFEKSIQIINQLPNNYKLIY